MSSVWSIIFSETFFYGVLRVATPILFAAMASLICSKAGVINISIEGTMLSSALMGVIVSSYTQSAAIGLLGAIVMGVLFSLALAFFSISMKGDIILAGIALNLVATGGTVALLYFLTNDKGMSTSLDSKVIPTVELPIIKDIPVLGPILSNHNLLTYLSLISVVVVYILLYKMPIGLRIRSVGENAHAVESVGINYKKVQYSVLMISGVFSGLAGAFMSMGYMSWFSSNMTAGRGFIAIAAESMGRGTPLGTLIASLAFGFADALSNSLQALRVPAEFIQMIPYLATIIGLTLYSIRKHQKSNSNRRISKEEVK